MKDITQIDLTRQEMLQLWLKRNCITQADIARKLGVMESSISMMLRAETISSWRHGQLTKLGLPAELLPPALDKAPGPKKKSGNLEPALQSA